MANENSVLRSKISKKFLDKKEKKSRGKKRRNS